MGAALGLLLVFRNNTAYEKWWEARKCLGELVNVSRNLAITLNNLVPEKDATKSSALKLLTAFPFALKEHLRKGVISQEVRMLEREDFEKALKSNHVPNAIVNLLNARLKTLHFDKKINDMQHYLLLTQSGILVDVAGKCERIKNTPIPMAYAFMLKFFIIVYVLMLPFGLMDTLGWSVIPLTVSLYYIMMSIVMIAEEIEDPFGHELNDLPVDEITRNIERNIKEIISYNDSEVEHKVLK